MRNQTTGGRAVSTAVNATDVYEYRPKYIASAGNYPNQVYTDSHMDVIYCVPCASATTTAWRAGNYTNFINDIQTFGHASDMLCADDLTPDIVNAFTQADQQGVTLCPGGVNSMVYAVSPAYNMDECVGLDPEELYGAAEGEDTDG